AEPLALFTSVGAQVTLENFAQYGEACGARNRVPFEGVTLDKARVLGDWPPEGIGDRPATNHRGQRRVAAAQAFAHTQNVGHHAKRLGREHVSGPTNPGDDLVED